MPFTGRDAVKRDLMAESGREETDLVGKSTGFLDSSERDAVHGAEQRMGTPVFEMVVLGSGGGPLETDCSGYLLKPFLDGWEDGFLALEGGSGLGALATLLERDSPSELFPGLSFPSSHDTPVLQAAYVFSFLTCYLITHAHLDHALSLILLSGSVPPRPSEHSQPPQKDGDPSSGTRPPRLPVYGTKATMEKLALAYGGELWPELSSWDPGEGSNSSRGPVNRTGRKRRKTGQKGTGSEGGTGVLFSPLAPSKSHRRLHPTLPISTLTFPVVHGCTSRGTYESSAMFIRYDPLARAQDPRPRPEEEGRPGREFLFFGDVESEYRAKGEEGYREEQGKQAGMMNRAIWEEAAKSAQAGRLAGIFIECSYDSARPAHLMFGHLSPPGLYHELLTLASFVQSEPRPLEGLRIFVTHIKDALMPHPSGKSAREMIMTELQNLEEREEGGLGVEFVEVKKGNRILI